VIRKKGATTVLDGRSLFLTQELVRGETDTDCTDAKESDLL